MSLTPLPSAYCELFNAQGTSKTLCVYPCSVRHFLRSFGCHTAIIAGIQWMSSDFFDLPVPRGKMYWKHNRR